MIRVPNLYTPEQVNELVNTVSIRTAEGRLIPARPCGLPDIGLFKRLYRAWLVFTGQADVLMWDPRS